MVSGIIDIHTHILPGIDDGSRDWAETRTMLSMAYEQGIRTIIATPHYSMHQVPERIRGLEVQAAEEARKIDPDFTVHLGQEILYFDSIAEHLRDGHAFTIAGSRFILVEFLPNDSYHKIYQGIRKIQQSGYNPILAHIERYRSLRVEDHLEELEEMGCRCQMNYESLEGNPLHADVRWCRRQVKSGRIELLGSDMHRMDFRKPRLKPALQWLESHVEKDLIDAMTYKNANAIIEHQQLD